MLLLLPPHTCTHTRAHKHVHTHTHTCTHTHTHNTHTHTHTHTCTPPPTWGLGACVTMPATEFVCPANVCTHALVRMSHTYRSKTTKVSPWHQMRVCQGEVHTYPSSCISASTDKHINGRVKRQTIDATQMTMVVTYHLLNPDESITSLRDGTRRGAQGAPLPEQWRPSAHIISNNPESNAVTKSNKPCPLCPPPPICLVPLSSVNAGATPEIHDVAIAILNMKVSAQHCHTEYESIHTTQHCHTEFSWCTVLQYWPYCIPYVQYWPYCIPYVQYWPYCIHYVQYWLTLLYSRSQHLTCLSSPAENRYGCLGLTASPLTVLMCPVSVSLRRPLASSQSCCGWMGGWRLTTSMDGWVKANHINWPMTIGCKLLPTPLWYNNPPALTASTQIWWYDPCKWVNKHF